MKRLSPELLVTLKRYGSMLLVGAIGFLLMSGGTMLYRDWEFLHSARLITEYQQTHPLQAAGQPAPVTSGKAEPTPQAVPPQAKKDTP